MARLPNQSAEWLKKACGVCEELHKDLPNRLDILLSLGRYYGNHGLALWKAKNQIEARASLERSVELFAKLTSAVPDAARFSFEEGGMNLNLGMLREELAENEKAAGSYSHAAEAFARAVALDPERANYRGYLFSGLDRQRKIWKRTKNPQRMEEFCKQAVALLEPLATKYDHTDLKVELAARQSQLGLHYLQFGPIAKAVEPNRRAAESFEELADKEDGDSENRQNLIKALWNLGSSLDLTGKQDEAESAYRKALNIDPSDPESQSRLAWFLANCPDLKIRRPKEALDLARKASNTQPHNSAHWCAIGAAYYRLDRWQEAIDALEKAKKYRGYEPLDLLFLAMAYERIGKPGEAKTWFHHAQKWMKQHNLARGVEDMKMENQRFRNEAAELLGIKTQNDTEKPTGN